MNDAKPNDDLARYADRLDRVLGEIEDAQEALADLKTEIKSAGFDAQALIAVVRLRRDEKKRVKAEEKLQQLALYADRLSVQLRLEI